MRPPVAGPLHVKSQAMPGHAAPVRAAPTPVAGSASRGVWGTPGTRTLHRRPDRRAVKP